MLPVGPGGHRRRPEVGQGLGDRRFGTADKAVLVLGTLFSLAVIGSIVGMLAVSEARAAAYSVTAVVGLIGVWAVLDAAGADVRQAAAADRRHAGVDRRAVVPRRPSTRAAAAESPSTATRPTTGRSAGAASCRGRRRSARRRRWRRSSGDAEGPLRRRRRARRLALPAPTDTAAPVDQSPSSGLDGTLRRPRCRPRRPTSGSTEVTPWVVPNGDFYRIDTALAVPQVPEGLVEPARSTAWSTASSR